MSGQVLTELEQDQAARIDLQARVREQIAVGVLPRIGGRAGQFLVEAVGRQ